MLIHILLAITALGIIVLALSGDYRALRSGSPRFHPPLHMALATILLIGTETTGTVALIAHSDATLELIRIGINLCGWVVLIQLRGMVRVDS